MKQTVIDIPSEYLEPLNLNGLNGRSLNLPASKKKFSNRNYLVLYGHHSSLERMYSISQNIADYGNVIVPDIPGFGGMDSFYIIGKKPTIDNYADYLASLIKLKFRGKRLSIVGMSFGFIVVTRMLQKYPEIAKKVDHIISLVGFSDVSDFKISKNRINILKYFSKFSSGYISSRLIRLLFINRFIIKSTYRILSARHPKMKDAKGDELNKRLDFEVYLWKINDIRTYMYTTNIMMNISTKDIPIKHELIHITVNKDQYFNKLVTKKNLQKIYSNVLVYEALLGSHAPTVISDYRSASDFIPKKVRKMLSK